MEPDFEVVKVLTELLDELNIGDYEVTRASKTVGLVAILVNDLTLAAQIAHELRDARKKAEFGITRRVVNHINRAKQSSIPWMILVGHSEIDDRVVKLKNINANKEEEIPRDKIVEELLKRLSII